MNYFRWRKASSETIGQMMNTIHCRLVTHTLSDQLEAEYKDLLTKSKITEGIEDEINTVIRWVAKAVTARQKVVVNDLFTHTRQDAQIKILQAGLRDFEEIRLKHGIPASAQDVIKNATNMDFRAFQKIIIEANVVKHPEATIVVPISYQHEEITVYRMGGSSGDSNRTSYLIPRNNLAGSTCGDVIKHLMGRIKPTPHALDIWVRHHGKHQKTRDQFSWGYLPETEDIFVGEMVLEFITRPSSHRDEYIIVLVHENNKDVPRIIELRPTCLCQAHSLPGDAIGGENCQCNTLESHFNSLWPESTVIVTAIESQNDVLPRELGSFEPRTNKVMVVLTPLPAFSAATHGFALPAIGSPTIDVP